MLIAPADLAPGNPAPEVQSSSYFLAGDPSIG
jgi:hypothetical protein